MIFGIGTDILEISRIKKSVNTKRIFIRVFSPEECELFKSRDWNIGTIAANFCGKEAFFKSVGTGIVFSQLNKISILRNKNGKPYIVLKDELLNQYKDIDFYISLSHTRENAIAFVTAEKRRVQ